MGGGAEAMVRLAPQQSQGPHSAPSPVHRAALMASSNAAARQQAQAQRCVVLFRGLRIKVGP